TVPAALRSVDLLTGEADAAHVERSDTCAVPAAAVVGEAVVALCVADALLAKLGGDSMDELYAALRLAWRRARPLAGHVWLCGLPGSGKTTLAPLLAGNPAARLAELAAAREPLYARLADGILDVVPGASPQQISAQAAAVISALEAQRAHR